MCEEYESLHYRSGQLDVVMGQSIVLSEIKAEVLLENDDAACQNFLLQRCEERIERLSQTDKVNKFCMDAGFLSVVAIGQYFLTKDTGEQFYAKACREYTLPRYDGSSQPKGWIQGNTKIGPVRDFEESNPSSSTLSDSTTRRRRSSSILEDQELSSESISTNSLLV